MDKQIQARLKAVERRWAWEDKQSGYTVYRRNKPAYRRKSKQPSPWADLAAIAGAMVVLIAILSL